MNDVFRFLTLSKKNWRTVNEFKPFRFISVVCFSGSFEASSSYDEVNIIFFYGPSISELEYFSLTSIDQVSSHENFNSKFPTALYIHGYRENFTSESVQTVVKAFLSKKTHNVLVLNWSVYANGNYVTNAVPNLIKVNCK